MDKVEVAGRDLEFFQLAEKGLASPGDYAINPALTNMTIGYEQEAGRFGAGMVSPEISSQKQDGKFYEWERGDFWRDEAELRAPGQPAPMSGQRINKKDYHCDVYHLCAAITEEDLANEDPAISLEETVTSTLVQKLLIKRERVWASKLFTTGKWFGSSKAGGGDLVGATDFTYFNNFTGSNPVIELKKQILHMSRNVGVMKRDITMMMGPEVELFLQEHPKFKENFEQNTPAGGIIGNDKIRQVLGIKQVVVPEAAYTTSAPTLTGKDATTAFIAGRDILLSYAPAAPGKRIPSASYMFNWTGLLGSAPNGIRVSMWFERSRAYTGWIIMAEIAFDPRLTSSVAGVFFQNAIDPALVL